MKKSNLKIIWAMDPMESPKETESQVGAFVSSLAKSGAQLSIEVVSILSPDQLQLSTPLHLEAAAQYEPLVKKTLAEKIKKISVLNKVKAGAKGSVTSKIIYEYQASLGQSVDLLVSHAKKQKADLIVTGSHSRSGVDRFFLGSFAESLVLHADVPVVVVGKKSKVDTKVNLILFPTDFGKRSEKSYAELLQFAKGVKAKVLLLNAWTDPVEPVIQNGVYLMGGGWVPLSDFFRSDREAKERLAKKWVELGKKQGIKVDFDIATNGTSVKEAILKSAKKNKVSLIALQSRSGVFTTSVIGSVSRAVVREAGVPVWILHPKK